jgi:hypothetical protein
VLIAVLIFPVGTLCIFDLEFFVRSSRSAADARLSCSDIVPCRGSLPRHAGVHALVQVFNSRRPLSARAGYEPAAHIKQANCTPMPRIPETLQQIGSRRLTSGRAVHTADAERSGSAAIRPPPRPVVAFAGMGRTPCRRDRTDRCWPCELRRNCHITVILLRNAHGSMPCRAKASLTHWMRIKITGMGSKHAISRPCPRCRGPLGRTDCNKRRVRHIRFHWDDHRRHRTTLLISGTK